MAKEGLYSEWSGSENHTKESTQAADKTHRRNASTHMQMTWIVRVAHAANGSGANKPLLAANTYFICTQQKNNACKAHGDTHTQQYASEHKHTHGVVGLYQTTSSDDSITEADLSESISVPRHY